jgi:predicted dinucleotide-binding enzyme
MNTMQQRIAVIGAGSVGSALAAGLTAAGHQVAIGVREPDQERHSDLPVAATTISAAVSDAAVVILAVPADALETVVPALELRAGQVVVDATNAVITPIPDGFATLGEFVGSLLAADVALVKAFNTVGAEHLAGGDFDHPTFLPIAGDDPGTTIVADLAADLGFDVAVLGGRDTFALVENHARLWIHLAFRRGWGRDFAWTTVRR